MRVKIYMCRHCSFEVESSINWRRDVQAHYNNNHKKDKKYISAIEIKINHFKPKTIMVSNKITEAPHYGTTTD